MSNVWDYRQCVWDYRESTWTLDRDLIGYDVEATDGCIGTIEQASNESSRAYVVVDAGSWIPETRKLVPAGAIAALDHVHHRVDVGLTKDQIRDAPDYDAEQWNDDTRSQHGDYYRRHTP